MRIGANNVRSAAARCMVAATVLLALSRPVAAMECGDVDESGAVTASDALSVLRKAVGLGAGTLRCPNQCIVVTTTSTTTNTTGDQCFDDEDCEDFEGKPHCGGASGYECVACDNDDSHCEAGSVCAAYECVPD